MMLGLINEFAQVALSFAAVILCIAYDAVPCLIGIEFGHFAKGVFRGG